MDVHTKLKERLQARVKREGKKVSKKGKTSILFFSFPIDRGVENKYKSRFDGRQEELHKNKCLLPWKKTREKLLYLFLETLQEIVV